MENWGAEGGVVWEVGYGEGCPGVPLPIGEVSGKEAVPPLHSREMVHFGTYL